MYCNLTTDLTDVYSQLAQFNLAKEIEEWTITSGQTYTYYKGGVGQVNMVFEDGVKLALKTSIATVEAAAGSWWWDSATNLLYVQTTGTDTPNDTYIIEAGEDWTTFITRCRNDAAELIDSWLNKLYITPLIARDSKDHSSNAYELPLRRSCAALTCFFVLNRRNPGDPDAQDLYKIAWNPDPEDGEPVGYINQYLNKDLVRQDEVTPREGSGYNIFPYASNVTTEPGIQIEGDYKGNTFQMWRITITTGGAPDGTMIWKFSDDDGTTNTRTSITSRTTGSTNLFETLSGSMKVKFTAATYTANDYWQIEVYPQDSTLEGGKKINSIKLVR